MASKLLVLAALVAISAASYVPGDSYQASAPANYNFNGLGDDAYSGNNYGHFESRNGDNTQVHYFVQLPDGRLQEVTYNVQGNSGYQGLVTYEDEAQYPDAGYGRPATPPTQSFGTTTPDYTH